MVPISKYIYIDNPSACDISNDIIKKIFTRIQQYKYKIAYNIAKSIKFKCNKNLKIIIKKIEIKNVKI